MTDQTADTALKDRHRSMWAAGDYGEMVQTFLLPLGETLVRACSLGPGTRVLDVAAGTGNAAIAAARTGASVTASDLTPELIAVGRRRTEAESLDLEWIQADAEHLPFEDATFDVVMSSIGVMFAPHHRQAAHSHSNRQQRPSTCWASILASSGLTTWCAASKSHPHKQRC